MTSDPGRVLPGAYALSDLALSPEGIASGRIDGVVMQAFGDRLVAPSSSRAPGLVVELSPGVAAAARVTISGGLTGILRSVRDTLSGANGALTRSRASAEGEARRIADDRAAAERRASAYRAQLEMRFSSMDRLVGGFRATQAYLTQQIAAWNATER